MSLIDNIQSLLKDQLNEIEPGTSQFILSTIQFSKLVALLPPTNKKQDIGKLASPFHHLRNIFYFKDHDDKYRCALTGEGISKEDANYLRQVQDYCIQVRLDMSTMPKLDSAEEKAYNEMDFSLEFAEELFEAIKNKDKPNAYDSVKALIPLLKWVISNQNEADIYREYDDISESINIDGTNYCLLRGTQITQENYEASKRREKRIDSFFK